MLGIRRREFIAALGSAAAWPIAARGQRSEPKRRIGFLTGGGIEADPVSQASLAAIREGLAKLGWVEGRNLQIDRRFGSGDLARIRFYAEELVSLAPQVVIVTGGPATRAVQKLTRTIPIVFVSAGDPVENGLVNNIARPDGNATGFTNQFATIGGKWVELLKEAAPHLVRVALVYNPETYTAKVLDPMETAATARSVKAIRIPFHDPLELVRGIDEFATEPKGGLIVPSSATTGANRSTIIRLAAQHHLPAIYPYKYYAAEGGLMAYGPDRIDLFSRAPSYVDRLLRGARVSDLPVQFPTKFELVINLKTAKALSLPISPEMLAIADEIIE
jgi:putative ABC transport system substrate-binding protein